MASPSKKRICAAPLPENRSLKPARQEEKKKTKKACHIIYGGHRPSRSKPAEQRGTRATQKLTRLPIWRTWRDSHDPDTLAGRASWCLVPSSSSSSPVSCLSQAEGGILSDVHREIASELACPIDGHSSERFYEPRRPPRQCIGEKFRGQRMSLFASELGGIKPV